MTNDPAFFAAIAADPAGMIEAVLAFGALVGVVTDLCRRDKARYRDGSMHPPVLNLGAFKGATRCRIHKQGGLWFFRLGRFGGSVYLSRQVRKIGI
jgi:hypothetical protein